MKRTSAELKRIARGHLLGHYGLLMGAAVVAGLISTVVLMPFQIVLNPTRSVSGFVIYQLVAFAVRLVASILYGGLIRIHLALARGEAPSFSELFSCFQRRPDRFILVSLLTSLIGAVLLLPGYLCVLGAIYTGGSLSLLSLGILLLLAGIALNVFVSLHLALTQTLLAEHDSMGVMDSLRQSYTLMQGNKGRLFYISLSFIGWSILALLSCGLGFLWLAPYMRQTSVAFYLDVTKRLPEGHIPREHVEYRV